MKKLNMHESCSDAACFVPLLETPTHTIHNYDCSWKTKETTRLLLWAHIPFFSFQFSSDLFWTCFCHLSKILAEYTKKSWICSFFITISCIHHIFRSTFVTNMFVQKRQFFCGESANLMKIMPIHGHFHGCTVKTTRNLYWFCHVR